MKEDAITRVGPLQQMLNVIERAPPPAHAVDFPIGLCKQKVGEVATDHTSDACNQCPCHYFVHLFHMGCRGLRISATHFLKKTLSSCVGFRGSNIDKHPARWHGQQSMAADQFGKNVAFQ